TGIELGSAPDTISIQPVLELPQHQSAPASVNPQVCELTPRSDDSSGAPVTGIGNASAGIVPQHQMAPSASMAQVAAWPLASVRLSCVATSPGRAVASNRTMPFPLRLRAVACCGPDPMPS